MKCKWIKVKVGVFNDEKIRLIDTQKNRNSILIIFFKLLDLAGSINDEGRIGMDSEVGYTNEELKVLFNRDEREVKNSLDILERYGIIQRDDKGVITITNWAKYQDLSMLEDARVKNKLRKRVQRSRAKEKALEEKLASLDEEDALALDEEKVGQVTNVTGERREEKRKEEKKREEGEGEKIIEEDVPVGQTLPTKIYNLIKKYEMLQEDKLTSKEKNIIILLAKKYGVDTLDTAIDTGVLRNNINLNYIKGVVSSLSEEGGEANSGSKISRADRTNIKKNKGKIFEPQKPKKLSDEEYRESEGELI